MVTRLLKDDLLRKAIDKKVKRRGKKEERRGEDNTGERGVVEFEDGFEAINAEVERLVNERFRQEKDKQVQQQKLPGSQCLYRLPPTSTKRPAVQSLAPSPPRYTIATSTPPNPPPLRRAVPRLQLLHSLSPQQTITQNLSILKRTHQFFLGNVRPKGRVEQMWTDRSFFLT